MTAERKQLKLVKEESSDEEVDDIETKMTNFRPTNVMFEVDGHQFHLNKEWLAEKSPVFKRMFESEFEEKNMSSIKLRKKSWEAFQQFLCSFHFDDSLCSIKEDTVLNILPLADEYQIESVKDRCEAFIRNKLLMAQKKRMDLETFLVFVNYADRYKLSSALPLAPALGAQYSIEELKDADIDNKVSLEIRAKIFEERLKKLEPCSEKSVLELIDVLRSKKVTVTSHHESIFLNAINLFPSMRSNADTLGKVLNMGEIFGERCSDKKLLFSAIKVASEFNKVTKEKIKIQYCSPETRRMIEERIKERLEESDLFGKDLGS